ncbi:uncharacterized protein LOC135824615 isoform X2 [Sycon ciliatum]|uniref:uncharacterized protein LOC135824615 isoform X2 n=1 Tax=Sycon ciliatum TaxID=27933 RepID=UPI0031F71B9F
MSCFLNREGAPGTFPISGALDHCKVLCPSLARLQYLTRQEMATIYEGKSGYGNPLGKYRPKTTELAEMAPVIKSHLHPLTPPFINKLMDDPDDYVLPAENLVQLRHVALMASKYVRSTKEFRMVELLPSAQEAITFWNMVYRAHKKVYKQPVEKLSTLLDDPDGTTLDHVKDLASLPELCRLIAQNLDILAKSKEEK